MNRCGFGLGSVSGSEIGFGVWFALGSGVVTSALMRCVIICQVVRLWHLAKGESSMTLYGHEHVVNAVRFSSGPADTGIAEFLLKVSE